MVTGKIDRRARLEGNGPGKILAALVYRRDQVTQDGEALVERACIPATNKGPAGRTNGAIQVAFAGQGLPAAQPSIRRTSKRHDPARSRRRPGAVDEVPRQLMYLDGHRAPCHLFPLCGPHGRGRMPGSQVLHTDVLGHCCHCKIAIFDDSEQTNSQIAVMFTRHRKCYRDSSMGCRPEFNAKRSERMQRTTAVERRW